jgi:deoxyribonuclease-4
MASVTKSTKSKPSAAKAASAPVPEPQPRLRVRQILDTLSTTERTALKKLLPKGTVTDKTIKELGNTTYPSALLGTLPKEESYCLMGHIAEAMLREPTDEITFDTLIAKAKEYYPDLTDAAVAKVQKSKTTEPFLAKLRATREELEAIFEGPVAFEPTFTNAAAAPHVEGHPDMVCEGHIFELKLAGQPKKDWTSFLFQLFAYAAIDTAATAAHLVLPLHTHIWSFDLADWPTKDRKAYLAFLEAAAVKAQANAETSDVRRAALFERYNIGVHIQKKGTVADSIAHLDPAKPWQIFISSNRSTKVAVKAADIAATAEFIAGSKHRVFVHAPYLINLAADPETDEYNVKCLADTLTAAAQMGLKGVVVHVGKSTTQEPAQAIANMRTNLLTAMESATADCPILLETPAGQGTELLCKHTEFMEFIEQFDDDPRLRVCVDTCHVFAAGEDPLTYIKQVVLFHADMLKLIHFNDSEEGQGCCKDRHAAPGSGSIGFEKMEAIAEFASAEGVPMVFE